MKIGKLRHRLAILDATETRDASGGVVRSEPWVTLATRWGSVEPLRGRELLEAGQMTPRVDTRIRMRYYEGLKTIHRLQLSLTAATHTFEILSILDAETREQELEIMAVEVPDGV